MKIQPSFIYGIGFGFLAAAIVLSPRMPATVSKTPADPVVARVGAETLSQSELDSFIRPLITSMENNQYQSRLDALNQWLDNEAIRMEAKSRSISTDELIRLEVESKTLVADKDVQAVYSSNPYYRSKSFSEAASGIRAMLQRDKTERGKGKYAAELRKKYRAEILLKAPPLFVPKAAGENNQPADLGKPSMPPALKPVSPQPPKQEDVLPSAPPKMNPNAASLPVPGKGPENAKILIEQHADFICPYCKDAIQTIASVMSRYPKDVRFTYHHYPLSPMPGTGSYPLHEAAACAEEQGKFWPFHDALYNAEGRVDSAKLTEIARSLNLDMKRFGDCTASGKYRDWIAYERDSAEAKGVNSTPSFFINGEMVKNLAPNGFISRIENILHPENKPKIMLDEDKEKRVVIDDLKNKPSMGPENAPVTIVEFSDFHCPFCKKIAPTLDQIMANFPGKVRRVWRHYPLPMHKGSPRAHEASQCAAEQGKFWEFHAKLFEVSPADQNDEVYKRFAKEIGLKQKKFDQCLNEGKYKKLIEDELVRGNAYGVDGTPAVFINGKLYSGAYPYAFYESVIKKELQSKENAASH